jgi:hypothetical protein
VKIYQTEIGQTNSEAYGHFSTMLLLMTPNLGEDHYASIPELELDFSKSKTLDRIDVGRVSESDNIEIQNECSRLGLQPFRKFAYQFYDDERWIKEDSINWLDDRFNYLGLRFVITNTAEEINCNKMSIANKRETRSAKIIEEAFLNLVDDLFTVLVSHHGFASWFSRS